MSERVQFARTVRFKATHYYRVAAWDQETNHKHFGDAAEPHLHHWAVTCWFEGTPNDHGMIVNLIEVDQILNRELIARYDGASLNEGHPYFKDHQPTTEAFASLLGKELPSYFAEDRLVRIRVAECEDLFAEWHR